MLLRPKRNIKPFICLWLAVASLCVLVVLLASYTAFGSTPYETLVTLATDPDARIALSIVLGLCGFFGVVLFGLLAHRKMMSEE